MSAQQLEQRLSDWNKSLALSCGRYTTQLSQSDPFSGQIDNKDVSDIVTSLITTNAHSITKYAVDEPAGGNFHYFIILQLQGSSLFEQGKCQVVLNTGDIAIMDQRLPCKLTHKGTVQHLSAHIPITKLSNFIDEKYVSVAQKINTLNGSGYLLKVYLKQLYYRTNQQNGRLDLSNNLHSLINLWGAAIPGCGGKVSRQLMTDLQFNQLKIVLCNNLSDTSLNIESIAKSQHISKSKLYRFFGKHEITPYSWLKQRRLDFASQLMSLPEWQHRPIIEIANRAGFTDLAHFSRSFSAQFGQSPHRFRRNN